MVNSVQYTFKIPAELDKKFRDMIIKEKGYKKGSLTIALHEAIEDWIIKYDDEGSYRNKKISQKEFSMRVTCKTCKTRFISKIKITEAQANEITLHRLTCPKCANTDDYERRYIEFVESKNKNNKKESYYPPRPA